MESRPEATQSAGRFGVIGCRVLISGFRVHAVSGSGCIGFCMLLRQNLRLKVQVGFRA